MEDLPIGRIITEEDAKVYHLDGEVFGVEKDRIDLVTWNNPVAIVSGAQVVGYASVFEGDDKRLFAKLNLKYDTPERFDVQNGENLAVWANLYDGVVIIGLEIRHSKERLVSGE